VRVIEQARLWFREGTSDKVYEVDLVEIVAGQYVVNFRFGRRGTPLKDGTKTPLPVDAARARSIYQKLIDEKLAGGYQHGTPGSANAAPPPAAAAPPGGGSPYRTAPPSGPGHALIAALRQGARSDVPLGPVLWRVADLDLKEAEPVLLELLGLTFVPRELARKGDAWRYLIVSALARCGGASSVATLVTLADDQRTPPHTRDMARLAVARIEPERARDIGKRLLPRAMQDEYEKGDATTLSRAAEELLAVDPLRARAAAVGLYLINDAVARQAVFAIARVARLSNQEATIVRGLFRLAEARRDGELYGLIARRIDAHTSDRRPFSPKTRQYLRRRVARVLRRLGRAGSPDYAPMAAAILLGYDDEDAVDTKRSSGWGHRYDRFAPFHAFNEILHKNSGRYTLAHHTLSVWKLADRLNFNPPHPGRREEAFPVLWDRAPHVLWDLISKAGTVPVQDFATTALRGNTAYTAALRDEQLATVMATGHAIAQQFAFDIARTRPLSTALARGALASDIAAAQEWVVAWVERNQAAVAGDADMLALLVTGKTQRVRDAGVGVLLGRNIDETVLGSAAVRAIAILMSLGDTKANAERASGAVATILRVLAAPLVAIAPEILRDMVRHPLAAIGELAGELILRHARRDALPGDLLEAMLSSPHATVRLLGGRLLAQTPPEVAKDDLDALELFATSGNAELREATRTLLGAVATKFPDVGRELASRLVDDLLKTQPPGAPAHILALLRNELSSVLPRKPAATIMRLIGALSPHAREAGGLLLPQLGPDDIGLDDIARLTNNEFIAVRQGAWALARASIPRYKLAPVALAKLVDTEWDDSRAFAIGFIRDEIGADKLSADAIITICDSIRPQVQDLGKQLLYAQFKEADAGTYLARLAEHPSTNMQLLVSTLLGSFGFAETSSGESIARHADVEKLKQLAPFFATVLSQVNRGKVAKERVMTLLRREAAKSPEAAAVLAPLLDRQSATIAISQKYPLIATMVEVHELYPDVPLPLSVVPAGPSTSSPLHPRPPKGAE